MKTLNLFVAGAFLAVLSGCATHSSVTPNASISQPAGVRFEKLFPKDGVPQGWRSTSWDNLAKPPPEGAQWKVTNGVLHGSDPRGTWLVSEKEYGDFVLRFDWKLGERGNSGCALRAPMRGDPAFDGLELQMVDPRYMGDAGAQPDELTGSFYRAVPPLKQVYKPMDWNSYEITLIGSRAKIVLNGELIQDLDLNSPTKVPTRHDNTEASLLKDRPRRGHIGFQELSRGGGHVEIRNAMIREITERSKATSPESVPVPERRRAF